MKKNWWKWIAFIFFLGLIVYLGVSPLSMPGADNQVNAVAERYAREVGAGQRLPFINTNKGDLLLFVFTIGGAIAGFFIGFTWRDLFGKPGSEKEYSEKVVDYECP